MRKPIELPKEITDKAVAMKRSGMSHRSILEELKPHGATDKWLRRVTKDVTKEESLMDNVVGKIYKLATRPQGVKPSEINQVYYDSFGTVFNERKGRHVVNLSQKDKDNIKRKVNKLGKDKGTLILFTPEWVRINHIEQSKRILFESTQELHELLYTIQETYKDLFPDSNNREVSSFINEIVSLNLPRLSPRGIDVTFESLIDKLNVIGDNVSQLPISYKNITVRKRLDNIDDEIPY